MLNAATTEPAKGAARLGERIERAATTLHRFWQRVTEGLELEELWRQFRVEARESYDVYQKEVDWEATQRASKWKRPLYIARALFWAMLMKLSPARRVLLLLALAFLLLGKLEFTFGKASGTVQLGGYGILILFLLLALELADRVTMKRDLEIAREIQRWLVPEKPPEVSGLDIAFATRPANTVAGDYHDAFLRRAPDGSNKLLLVVADVAGKSVPAALLMATFQASLHALAAAPTPLIELVEGLNRYACRHSLGGLRFTTAFLAEFDPVTRSVTHVNAGHNAPILRRVSGAVERLEASGLPLGIEEAAPYVCSAATLDRGDLLLVFTDGIVEALNAAGEEFGDPRLQEALNAVPGESAAETLKHILTEVDDFVGSARQNDDITCLLLRAV